MIRRGPAPQATGFGSGRSQSAAVAQLRAGQVVLVSPARSCVWDGIQFCCCSRDLAGEEEDQPPPLPRLSVSPMSMPRLTWFLCCNNGFAEVLSDSVGFAPALSVVFGPQDRGGDGGDEGKKKFVYLKWVSYFWLYSEFHFPQRKFFLVLGGGLGGVPCAVRALCEKLAVLHHREFGKFRRLKGRH